MLVLLYSMSLMASFTSSFSTTSTSLSLARDVDNLRMANRVLADVNRPWPAFLWDLEWKKIIDCATFFATLFKNIVACRAIPTPSLYIFCFNKRRGYECSYEWDNAWLCWILGVITDLACRALNNDPTLFSKIHKLKGGVAVKWSTSKTRDYAEFFKQIAIVINMVEYWQALFFLDTALIKIIDKSCFYLDSSLRRT